MLLSNKVAKTQIQMLLNHRCPMALVGGGKRQQRVGAPWPSNAATVLLRLQYKAASTYGGVTPYPLSQSTPTVNSLQTPQHTWLPRPERGRGGEHTQMQGWDPIGKSKPILETRLNSISWCGLTRRQIKTRPGKQLNSKSWCGHFLQAWGERRYSLHSC